VDSNGLTTLGRSVDTSLLTMSAAVAGSSSATPAGIGSIANCRRIYIYKHRRNRDP